MKDNLWKIDYGMVITLKVVIDCRQYKKHNFTVYSAHVVPIHNISRLKKYISSLLVSTWFIKIQTKKKKYQIVGKRSL